GLPPHPALSVSDHEDELARGLDFHHLVDLACRRGQFAAGRVKPLDGDDDPSVAVVGDREVRGRIPARLPGEARTRDVRQVEALYYLFDGILQLTSLL